MGWFTVDEFTQTLCFFWLLSPAKATKSFYDFVQFTAVPRKFTGLVSCLAAESCGNILAALVPVAESEEVGSVAMGLLVYEVNQRSHTVTILKR